VEDLSSRLSNESRRPSDEDEKSQKARAKGGKAGSVANLASR
jgi:hypothetical protein